MRYETSVVHLDKEQLPVQSSRMAPTILNDDTTCRILPESPLADFVDCWRPVFSDDIQNDFPKSPCIAYDDEFTLPDGANRFWGSDSYIKVGNTGLGAWPAKRGTDSVNPATSGYPTGLYSWLRCGPFDLTGAQFFNDAVRALSGSARQR
jgi:hypothetical protein